MPTLLCDLRKDGSERKKKKGRRKNMKESMELLGKAT